MRIALVNPVTVTVDRPDHFWQLFGRKPTAPPFSDAEGNWVKLAQIMANEGHEVSLFVADTFKPLKPYRPNNGRLKIRYLPTHCRFLFPPAYIPWLPTLLGELQNGNFDCIQTADLLTPAAWIAGRTGLPLFAWEEIDQYFSRRITRGLQKLHHLTLERRFPSTVFAIPRSQAARHFLNRRGFKNILGVIPTPVDTEVFHPTPDSPEEYLLVVTRLAPDRGLLFLLDVMERVKTRAPTVKLLIVGSGSDEVFLKEEIARRNLNRTIEIKSDFFSHSALNKIYNQSTMTLITTEGGLYPYTASESMACGKPVISRFKRALRDLIQENHPGFLVDTPDQMAEKILCLLNNPAVRLAMGQAACRFVRSICSFPHVARRFLNCYKNHLVSLERH